MKMSNIKCSQGVKYDLCLLRKKYLFCADHKLANYPLKMEEEYISYTIGFKQ